LDALRAEINSLNILFVHQNFPGQFGPLAVALAAQPGNRVVALHGAGARGAQLPGVQNLAYRFPRPRSGPPHPWLIDLSSKVIRGDAALRAARALQKSGFNPDVIIAHPGWGESLFLKDVWPKAKLGIYCEFYYQAQGADLGFDPEFSKVDAEAVSRLRLKNAFYKLQEDEVDAGLTPTVWQRSTFPEPLRSKISVIHEGVDTELAAPNPNARLGIKTASGKNVELRPGDEIITFVNRNLEPYRGYHVFMRALPALLKARPKARVVLVGEDKTSYGAEPAQLDAWKDKGKSWKEIFLNEVISDLDMERVHFVGRIPYQRHLALLQISSVHVYLTYPFVLSWSLLEAMSTGCAVVASDTAPVREVITHGENGLLFDFFDRDALVARVCEVLEDKALAERLGSNAREFVRLGFDRQSICLPTQIEWAKALSA
jgi:glycosyltransferase involved in cell wall biosynthesis